MFFECLFALLFSLFKISLHDRDHDAFCQRPHLQEHFVGSLHKVRHAAEDEPAQAGRDADAQQQDLFVYVWPKALLHVAHLSMTSGTDENDIFTFKKLNQSQNRGLQSAAQGPFATH